MYMVLIEGEISNELLGGVWVNTVANVAAILQEKLLGVGAASGVR